MKSYVVLFVFTLGFLVHPSAFAQQEAPTVGVSYWKCDWGELGNIGQVTDSLYTPIMQELVDEGTIMNFGMLTHQWGDEWNVVFYITAPDTPTYLEASREAVDRFEERHPDVLNLTEVCSEHKDNIYTLRTATGAPSGMDE